MKNTAEKHLWKSSTFRKDRRCNNFSKVSLHFKKMANSFRKVPDIFRNIQFFFKKQSIADALKVLGKCLKAVLDEVHFIVNLYSFSLPPSPPGKPFLSPCKLFVPSQLKQLPKLARPLYTSATALVCIFSSHSLYFNAPFFCCLSFSRVSQPKVRIKKIVNIVSVTTLVFQDQPQGHIISYFYKLHRASSLSRILVEFSFKHIYSTMIAKTFQIYRIHVPRKCIESRYLYSCLSPSPVKTVAHVPSDNMKMTKNIRLILLCMICNFFKCDGFTFF